MEIFFKSGYNINWFKSY